VAAALPQGASGWGATLGIFLFLLILTMIGGFFMKLISSATSRVLSSFFSCPLFRYSFQAEVY
jgi:hypothetical protein